MIKMFKDVDRKRLWIVMAAMWVILSIPGIIVGIFVLWVTFNGGIGPAD